MNLKAGIALLGLVVAGCGGGGGGGGSTTAPPTPQGMQLSFTPGSLEATYYQGEAPAALEVSATASGVLPPAGSYVSVAVIDANGVLQPDAAIVQTGETTFKGTVKAAATLGVGTHTGAIVVRGCLDDPRTCAKPVAGSPWSLSYRFTVKSQTNPRDLASLPDANNHYGSASHNALSSASLDPGRFDRRWSNTNAGSGLPAAVGNGQLFAAIGGATLAAFSERDGSLTWQRKMDAAAASGPTWDAGRLFIATASYDFPVISSLQSFDATSGQPLAQVKIRGPIGKSANPVVRNGKVYLCTSSSSLSRFDAATLKEEWTVSLDANSTSPICSPAVDDRYVYIYQRSELFKPEPNLQAFDVATGARAFSIAAPSEGYYPPALQQAPVLGPNGRVYLALWDASTAYAFVSRLIAFDTVKRTLAWNVVVGNLSSNAVVGADAIYVANGVWLEARSLDTGNVLWSWRSGEPGPGGMDSPLMVIGKYAFISGAGSIFAVDLTTHQTVWQDVGAGSLTLSPSGALHVQRRYYDGVRVFNLN